MDRAERFNSLTHLAGAAFAVAGAALLIVSASREGDPWKIVSFTVYGVTLLLLFVFSTLYHGLRGRAKSVFRRLDHLAIYLLIAGSYTPFALVTLRGVWGWSLFGVVWGLAIVGVVLEHLPRRGPRILPVVVYLVMGWLALVAIKPLLAALPSPGFVWLVVGGLCYTVGIVFYSLDERLRYAHGVWHLFVLGGAIAHFFAVFYYVA